MHTFSVVSLGPVVASTTLAKDEVVGSEDLTKRSRPDTVHGARLKVHKNGPGHIPNREGGNFKIQAGNTTAQD